MDANTRALILGMVTIFVIELAIAYASTFIVQGQ